MLRSSPLKYLIHSALSLFLSFVFIPAFSFFVQAKDSVVSDSVPSQTEKLIRGERLFYGLLTPEDKQMNCARCHNIHYSDTLNWNPNAVEISEKYLNKTAADLSRVLINPSGEKMAQVHKRIQPHIPGDRLY